MKMKKIITILLILFSFVSAYSQSAIQKVAKSVFTLTTFKSDGTLLCSSHGVFVGPQGEALSTWTPFIGADKAVVIDTDGKKYDVEGIFGANEIYDVCKFKINSSVPSFAKLAARSTSAGGKVWIAEYAKKPKVKNISISRVETFGKKYSYYIFNPMDVENLEGCPLFNEQGDLLGLLQKSKTGNDVFSTDANFIDSVKTNGLSVKDPMLLQTNVRVMLPDNFEQASLMLIMANDSKDSTKYEGYVDAYINKYPSATDGYTAKARYYSNKNLFDDASKIMLESFKHVDKKDVAHSDYSGIIYNKMLYKPKVEYAPWTLDVALQEAQEAYKINPQPVYMHQQGQIIFAQGDYQKAYDIFMSLTKTSLRGGEMFYEAAQCKIQQKAPKAEIIVLLDSAVNACRKPLDVTGAQFVLARAAAYDDSGDYRKALVDYNRYDTLMMNRADAEFYYIRYKCEMKIRQYQQALNDIAHAAVINPAEPTYLAELASLQLHVGDFEKAAQAADLCIKVAPNYTDAYLIRGIALVKSNHKEDGMASLEKAKELGDTRAQGFIDKYK
jgi:tetratricopeptide (TPR) repeat protein